MGFAQKLRVEHLRDEAGYNFTAAKNIQNWASNGRL